MSSGPTHSTRPDRSGGGSPAPGSQQQQQHYQQVAHQKHTSYSASTSPSLPYPPGSSPTTVAAQQQYAAYPSHGHTTSLSQISQSSSRPPYPHMNKPPQAQNPSGPVAINSTQITAMMGDMRLPQRSATDPVSWQDPHYPQTGDDTSRERSLTAPYPTLSDSGHRQPAYPDDPHARSRMGRVADGLGLGPFVQSGRPNDQHHLQRQQYPHHHSGYHPQQQHPPPPHLQYHLQDGGDRRISSMGIAGPGPNTERRLQNPNNLQIVPPSPSRRGRNSPNRSPTTPNNDGTIPNYMLVPLPPGSDQSHQSVRIISSVGGSHGSRSSSQTHSPTFGGQANGHSKHPPHSSDSTSSGRPYDSHYVSSTAPGPPVTAVRTQSGSGMSGPRAHLNASSAAAAAAGGGSHMSSTASGSTVASATTSNANHSTHTNPPDSCVSPVGSEPKSASREGNGIGHGAGNNGLVMGPSGHVNPRPPTAGGLPSGSVCGLCALPVKRQFVRAMGKVYHLDCFRCKVSVVIRVLLYAYMLTSAGGGNRTAMQWSQQNSFQWTIPLDHIPSANETILPSLI